MVDGAALRLASIEESRSQTRLGSTGHSFEIRIHFLYASASSRGDPLYI
jgi:hypothetical protein